MLNTTAVFMLLLNNYLGHTVCQALGRVLGTQMSKAGKAPVLQELTLCRRKTIKNTIYDLF